MTEFGGQEAEAVDPAMHHQLSIISSNFFKLLSHVGLYVYDAVR